MGVSIKKWQILTYIYRADNSVEYSYSNSNFDKESFTIILSYSMLKNIVFSCFN